MSEMICGVGSDIVEIARVKKAARKDAFIFRVFTEREVLLCREKPDFSAALAVRFAGKEAVLKAFGTGLRRCRWRDIEIVSGLKGEPQIVLYGGARNIALGLGIKNIWISMSHSKENAIAFCVAEGGGDKDETGNGGGNAPVRSNRD